MTKINTSVRIDREILHCIDERVKDRIFSSRTHAFEYALRQLVKKGAPPETLVFSALRFNTDYLNRESNPPSE